MTKQTLLFGLARVSAQCQWDIYLHKQVADQQRPQDPP